MCVCRKRNGGRQTEKEKNTEKGKEGGIQGERDCAWMKCIVVVIHTSHMWELSSLVLTSLMLTILPLNGPNFTPLAITVFVQNTPQWIVPANVVWNIATPVQYKEHQLNSWVPYPHCLNWTSTLPVFGLTTPRYYHIAVIVRHDGLQEYALRL